MKPDLSGKGFLKKVMIFQLSCWFVVTDKTLYQVSLTDHVNLAGAKNTHPLNRGDCYTCIWAFTYCIVQVIQVYGLQFCDTFPSLPPLHALP